MNPQTPQLIKVRVTIDNEDHGVVFNDDLEFSTAALRGQPEFGIEMILREYVYQWVERSEWASHIERVRWQVVDQGAFGLEFKPSEPRDV
jgi:hypothetical protein